MAGMYELRHRIENVIDRGEWKNSWHLPKCEIGTKWSSPETAKQVKALLEDAVASGVALITEANSLLRQIDWNIYEDDGE